MPVPSHPISWDVSHGIPIGMTFPWASLGLSMGHIYLSHSHPIAIYACPIPWDVSPWDSHRNDIPMDKPADSNIHPAISCITASFSYSSYTD